MRRAHDANDLRLAHWSLRLKRPRAEVPHKVTLSWWKARLVGRHAEASKLLRREKVARLLVLLAARTRVEVATPARAECTVRRHPDRVEAAGREWKYLRMLGLFRRRSGDQLSGWGQASASRRRVDLHGERGLATQHTQLFVCRRLRHAGHRYWWHLGHESHSGWHVCSEPVLGCWHVCRLLGRDTQIFRLDQHALTTLHQCHGPASLGS